jgi:hypothetical protein
MNYEPSMQPKPAQDRIGPKKNLTRLSFFSRFGDGTRVTALGVGVAPGMICGTITNLNPTIISDEYRQQLARHTAYPARGGNIALPARTKTEINQESAWFS